MSMIRPSEAHVRMRHNVLEQVDALKELNTWEASMRTNEGTSDAVENCNLSDNDNSPSHLKKNATKKSFVMSMNETNHATSKVCVQVSPNPIVVKAYNVEGTTESSSNSIDVITTERLKGNSFYSEENYTSAIECYTRCLVLCQYSCVTSFSNRAMSYLKLKDWENAERDASSALKIDEAHVKSYHRRAIARCRLGKIRASLKDLKIAENILLSNSDKSTASNALYKEICREKTRTINVLHDTILNAPRRSVTVNISQSNVVSQMNQSMIDYSKSAIRNHSKPHTWHEFESVWKKLSCDDDKISYLRMNITPSLLRNIYRNGIEDVELLVEIIRIASKLDCKTKSPPLNKSYIDTLGRLPKLDMIALMLDDKQRETIRQAISNTYYNSNGMKISRMNPGEGALCNHPISILLQ